MDQDEYVSIRRMLDSFREISQRLYQIMKEEADKLDITIMQTLVLAGLSRNPNSTLGDIAEEMHSSNSTMSGIVDRLVKANYVIREHAQSDRRLLTLRLTEEGERKQKEAYRQIMHRLSTQLNDYTSEDLNHLISAHDHLLKQLQS
ncbi:MarR family transcriptional regulator [Salicibibacter cibarius]|uniref:MarR family transcriptional regulator n=1 Tax=Salicibibacter cibarius TaxID=2743000 RepID=A0A7T7CA35_9BACI|nr:MarR family transcriptional regulator [Salicibibacter cibarius]QQK74435.1 MarR family transcriptional regulator [Salicibibacter cibarius]